MLEQVMMPEARSQITQRSVQTAQPGTPACTELPGPAWGNSGGEPRSDPAGGGFAGSLEGDVGKSAATASGAVKARAAARIARIDAVWNSPRGIASCSVVRRPGQADVLASATGPAAGELVLCVLELLEL
jgi:hypothetical protein